MDAAALLLGASSGGQWREFFQACGLPVANCGADPRETRVLEVFERGDTPIALSHGAVACVLACGDPGTTRVADRQRVRRIAALSDARTAMLLRIDGRGGIAIHIQELHHGEACSWSGNLLRLDELGARVVGELGRSKEWSILILRVREQIERLEVGKRFFGEIRGLVQKLDSAWEPRLDESDARRMSILTVCRFLFVYFLKARGWLGPAHFVASLFLHPQEKDLYRGAVEPLFFEALNTPRDQRKSARFEAIPYLNGGLFAPTRIETQTAVTLPDSMVRELVGTLERYRFAEPGSRSSGALDPILLSEVFERLMRVDERGRYGAFFTPPALVESVVEAALSDAVTAGPSAAAYTALLAGEPVEQSALRGLRQNLLQLRIVDPAVGSGAFLLGCHDRLAQLVDLVDRALGEFNARRSHDARTLIATSVLHGVDQSGTAVLIAVLRLWLALAASVPPGQAIEPLPNLQFRVRTGDSLLGTVDPGGPPVSFASEARLELGRILDQVVVAHGKQKEVLEEQLDAAMRSHLRTELERRLEEATIERRGLEDQSAAAGLACSTRGLTSAEMQRLRELRARCDTLSSAIGAVDDTTAALPFDWRLHFPSTSFDIVLGNPPWVRASALEPGYRAALARRYSWMRPTRGRSGYGSSPDLSVAFVERAFELARPGATVAMLLPSKVFRADYAARLRQCILADHGLVMCRDFAAENVRFFDAAAYPGLLVCRAGNGNRPSVVEVHSKSEVLRVPRPLIPFDSLPGAPWPLWSAECAVRARRLLSSAPRLDTRLSPRLGVKTGLNGAFINPPGHIGPTVPALTGASVARQRQVRLLFAHDLISGSVLDDVPEPTRRWLELAGDRLRRRTDASDETPPWALFRVTSEALGWRVVWRDIARELEAFAVPPVAAGGPVVLNTLYSISCIDEEMARALAAHLNSAEVRTLATHIAEPAAGGYRRFLGGTIGALPLPGFLCDPEMQSSLPWGAA